MAAMLDKLIQNGAYDVTCTPRTTNQFYHPVYLQLLSIQ